jgi:hypothetical protein
VIWVGLALVLIIAVGFAWRWGTRWGSTPEERARVMPGDDYLASGPRTHVAMTRAISIGASSEVVWPWIAQLGRGSGWYSVDWLDNGRRVSARHIVSWIPEPELGDATAIGYLRHFDRGRALAWWVNGVPFAGSQAQLVSCFEINAEPGGTRLVSRMSADAAGPMAPVALMIFRLIDSIMARSQLLGIRDRVEVGGEAQSKSKALETGARDQFQLYEVIYASGETAGLEGKEHAARWRHSAREDGVLNGPT